MLIFIAAIRVVLGLSLLDATVRVLLVGSGIFLILTVAQFLPHVLTVMGGIRGPQDEIAAMQSNMAGFVALASLLVFLATVTLHIGLSLRRAIHEHGLPPFPSLPRVRGMRLRADAIFAALVLINVGFLVNFGQRYFVVAPIPT